MNAHINISHDKNNENLNRCCGSRHLIYYCDRLIDIENDTFLNVQLGNEYADGHCTQKTNRQTL